MSLETKHNERLTLYQLLLILNGKQSVKQTISIFKAMMDPEDVKLVEKEIMDFLNENNSEQNK